jgi:hypothetical protein
MENDTAVETHSSAIDQLVAEEESASAEVASSEAEESDAGGDPEVEGAGDGDGETSSTAEQAETVEVGEDALRIIAKKGITLDKFNEYLKRYEVTAQEVNEKPKLAQLLLDKAASDELIAKQTKTEDPKKEESKQDPPDIATSFQEIAKEAEAFNDPKMVEHFASQLSAAAEKGDVKAQVQILTTGMHNYLKTALPQLLPSLLQSIQATQQKEYQERIDAHTSAWEPYAAQNPDFKDAVTAYNEAAARNPKLVNNPNLTPQERMEVVSLILGGKKAEAAEVAKAAEKGAEKGREQKNKSELGKVLGAGKSNPGPAKSKGNDDIFGEGVAEYRRRDTLGRP